MKIDALTKEEIEDKVIATHTSKCPVCEHDCMEGIDIYSKEWHTDSQLKFTPSSWIKMLSYMSERQNVRKQKEMREIEQEKTAQENVKSNNNYIKLIGRLYLKR